MGPVATANLEAELRAGESSFLELKDERVHPDSLAKEMAAFANTEGGVILLGVADDGSVTGISRPDIEEWVFNIARNNVKPSVLPLFELVEAQGKRVARITVQKDLAGPFSVSGRYYIRAGSTSRECTKEELGRLFQRSRYFYFEESPVHGSGVSHLDRDRIREYFRQVYEHDIDRDDGAACESLLKNSGILTQEGPASVVGLVMFGKRDAGQVPPVHAVQRFLPQAGAAYAHYSGTTIVDALLDSAQFEGTAPDLVERISEKLLLRLPRPSRIEGMKREELVPLPRKVLREALVNAVTHRDYSLQSKVRVFQFDDHLEVMSPGGLPNSVSIEKMKASYCAHRNPLVVKFMENLRYVDGLGRGVPMIFRSMRDLGAKEPEIHADASQVRLVIWFAPTA
ncbi:MAG: putative DNA binding domain-containing protein [Planctomycetes bacterium]|nr:putative DNA binding domain-containing protein [Planctomycetota bacterium]